MKLMPALPESIFDISYLIFAIATGLTLLKTAKRRRDIHLMGAAALFLGCGDAFHLIPRVLAYWTEGGFTAALGIGKLITSVTMTVFYLLLEYIRRDRHQDACHDWELKAMWVLVIIRIALCLFPQNAWTSAQAPLSWGIYRNIPFTMMGILAIISWYRTSEDEGPLRLIYIVIALSFAFYLPVVVLTDRIPAMGMLMLPKTVMYIWMLCMFRKAAKESENQRLKRIQYYEGLLNEATRLLDEGDSSDRLKQCMRDLEAYYASQEWKDDYAADEAGELPADLRRGVLSEDGIYNELQRYQEMNG